MDMDLIRNDWNALAGRRTAFTQRFYERLFERHPHYREMFPESMDAQTERMVEMLSGVVRFADHANLVRPYLEEVGHAHRRTGIGHEDVQNFTDTFIETLGEICDDAWDARHADAWRLAFDDLIVPLFEEGLKNTRQR
jgi:hemoglobin-like flavoprotein